MKTTREIWARKKAQIDNLKVIQAWQPEFLPAKGFSFSELKCREEAMEEIVARLKSNQSLYLQISDRSDHKDLIIEIIDTVMRYEYLVLCELNIIKNEDFNSLINPEVRRNKISQLKKELSAFELTSKRGENNINAQEGCEIELSIAQNPITLSREQEAKLLTIVNEYPDIVTILEPLSLKRKNTAPGKQYRNELIMEVYNLLYNHASNDQQRKPSQNTKLTSWIITTISPKLNSSAAFKPKDINNALY